MGNTQDTSTTPAGLPPDKQELRAWACQWLEISAELTPAEARRQVFRLLAEQDFEAPPAFIEAARIVAAEPEQLTKLDPVSIEYESWCDERNHERVIRLAPELRTLPSEDRWWQLGQLEVRPTIAARLKNWLGFMRGAQLPEFKAGSHEQRIYEFALELAVLPQTRRAVRRREILNECGDRAWSKAARKLLKGAPDLRALDPRFFAGLLGEEVAIPKKKLASSLNAAPAHQEASSWRGFGWIATALAIMVVRGCASSSPPTPRFNPTIYSTPQLRDEHGNYRFDFGQIDGRTTQLGADATKLIIARKVVREVMSESTEDQISSSLSDAEVQGILDSSAQRAALQNLMPTLSALQVRRILKQYERSDQSEDSGAAWEQLRIDLKARLDVLEVQETELKAELGIYAGIPRSKDFAVATLMDSKGGRKIVRDRARELSKEAAETARTLLEKRMRDFPGDASDYQEFLMALNARLAALKAAGERGENHYPGTKVLHLHFFVPARIDPDGSINLGSNVVELDEFLDQPWGLEHLYLRIPKLSHETLESLESALLRLESREPHRSEEIQKTQALIKSQYKLKDMLNSPEN